MQTVWVYRRFFSDSRRNRFLSLPVTELQLSTRENPYLNFFFLKMAIKREDVASYCELQTCCLALLQFPRCLETIMALQHLLMFDMLLNPQLLRAFEKNKYRRRNKHSLCSLTPSPSVTSGVWNRSRERGETLQRTQKRNTRLYESGACMYLARSAASNTSRCSSLEHWQTEDDDNVAGNIFLYACFCEWTVECLALVKQYWDTEGIKGEAGKARPRLWKRCKTICQ